MLLLCISSCVYAANPYQWPNLLGPAVDQAVNQLTLGWVSVNYDDFKDGEFYPISQWEFDVCTAGVTSDLASHDTTGDLGDSTDIKDLYGPLTAAINAQKYVYQVNNSIMTLYEIAWYVQPKPKTQEIKYTIYLKTDSGQKYYPSGLKDLVADPIQGDTGDYLAYLNSSDYTEVGIESGGSLIFKNKIVTNPFGVNYG